MTKIISNLYAILFFVTPFVFFPKSSELFEFNKMVFVYILTTIIVTTWFIKTISLKKFIFRRTLLDIPLLIFLVSQILATVFSIDRYTSIFGYYSRFNGGLMSTLSYLLLYWAYVSNLDSLDVKKHLKVILASATIVGIWGILEHFGKSFSCLLVTGNLSVDCWVQDVKNRVFASIGQPNWLAAWIVSILPLTWAITLNKKNRIQNYLPYILSSLFFLTLLFTKSRSGILGFVIADILFWGIILFKFKNYLYKFLITNFLFLIIALAFGTPWTPSLAETRTEPTETKIQGPALETGGTESGALRRIVWQGAVDLWRNYPIFGTGVETFAYSYYQFRPLEHNLTSEWDFLYNKAHNEYLNFAANSGTVGLIAYVFLIISIILLIIPRKNYFAKSKERGNLINTALLAGFVSLLVTNFFGFSVVLTNLQFFLFPALAISLTNNKQDIAQKSLNSKQKLTIILIIILASLSIFSIFKYWYADLLFTKGRNLTDQGDSALAIKPLIQASEILPYSALYHDQLASAYSNIAVQFNEQNQASESSEFVEVAKQETDKAFMLSPRNINLLKSRANIYTTLSAISEIHLIETIKTLQMLLVLAPTDASIYQRIGLALAQAGELDASIQFFEKAIDMKPDYKRARQALARVYTAQGKEKEATKQLEYILEFISPEDELIKSQLIELKKGQ